MVALSVHSLKCKRRHPDAPRDRIQVGHILFELSVENASFALIAGDALTANDRRPLFTGFVQRGMGQQLRDLADRFDQIEAGLPDDA